MVRCRIGHGEIPGHVGLQGTSGKIAPKTFQHHDGAIPLLLLNQQCGGIEIGVDANLGIGRQDRNPKEIVNRCGRIARLVLLLALLVDGACQPLDDCRPLRICCRHQALRPRVGRLGFVERSLIEVGVADHGPGDALLEGVRRRLTRKQRLRGRERARIVLRGVQVGGGPRQYSRALRMGRKGLGELQSAIGALHV